MPNTPSPAGTETNDAFVPEVSFKLGKQEHPSHILLYKDKGSPDDVNEPFAIVFVSAEIAPQMWHLSRHSFAQKDQPESVKRARIGQISIGVLPVEFYITAFTDVKEAVEQVEYFFSLSETQQLLLLNGKSNYHHHFPQDVRFAVSDYQKEITLINGEPESVDYVIALESAEKLLKSIAALISPFNPTSSAFLSGNVASIQITFLQWHVNSLAKAIRRFRVAVSEPLFPTHIATAYGGLQHAVACLKDGVEIHPFITPPWEHPGEPRRVLNPEFNTRPTTGY